MGNEIENELFFKKSFVKKELKKSFSGSGIENFSFRGQK